MSAAKVLSGVRKLLKADLDKTKILSSFAEDLESMVDMEAETNRIRDVRDAADEDYKNSCAKLATQREYTESESVKLDAQLKDKQGETQDAMDQFDENLNQKRMEYDNEVGSLEASVENYKTSINAEMAEMREEKDSEVQMLAHKTEAHMSAYEAAKEKRETAERDLKEFLAKHQG